LNSEPIVCVAFREEGRVTSGRYTSVNFSAFWCEELFQAFHRCRSAMVCS
jgi:hypothetical protein